MQRWGFTWATRNDYNIRDAPLVPVFVSEKNLRITFCPKPMTTVFFGFPFSAILRIGSFRFLSFFRNSMLLTTNHLLRVKGFQQSVKAADKLIANKTLLLARSICIVLFNWRRPTLLNMWSKVRNVVSQIIIYRKESFHSQETLWSYQSIISPTE